MGASGLSPAGCAVCRRIERLALAALSESRVGSRRRIRAAGLSPASCAVCRRVERLALAALPEAEWAFRPFSKSARFAAANKFAQLFCRIF